MHRSVGHGVWRDSRRRPLGEFVFRSGKRRACTWTVSRRVFKVKSLCDGISLYVERISPLVTAESVVVNWIRHAEKGFPSVLGQKILAKCLYKNFERSPKVGCFFNIVIFGHSVGVKTNYLVGKDCLVNLKMFFKFLRMYFRFTSMTIYMILQIFIFSHECYSDTQFVII